LIQASRERPSGEQRGHGDDALVAVGGVAEMLRDPEGVLKGAKQRIVIVGGVVADPARAVVGGDDGADQP
jgi:hypothetical protein